MEFAIGWFPYWAPGGGLSHEEATLRRRLPTLLPALIYGDAVTAICPEADDVMEMHDFGDVYRAANGGSDEYLGERSYFQIMSLDAAYPSEDDDDEEAAVEPLVPFVWIARGAEPPAGDGFCGVCGSCEAGADRSCAR
jgi:hypothetical protein